MTEEVSGYDPYRALASAIVQQAVEDLRDLYAKQYRAGKRIEAAEWRIEVGRAKKDYDAVRRAHREKARAIAAEKKLKQQLRDTEGFFYSDWFVALSDLGGPAIQERVQEEHEHYVRFVEGLKEEE